MSFRSVPKLMTSDDLNDVMAVNFALFYWDW